MTRLAIIFSLLFVTPVWAGEVDGNSFLCSGEDAGFIRALEFKNGKIHERIPGQSTEANYTAYPDTVVWGNPSVHYSKMNRKSLQLTWGYVSKNGELAVMQLYSCEFMDFSDAIEMVVHQEKKNMLKRKEKEKKLREGNQF